MVLLWDVRTGKTLRAFRGHKGSVQSVSWSPYGTRIASGSDDNTVRLWDESTGRELAVLQGHLGTVESVSWSPDARFVVSSGSDGTMRVWDATTGRCLAVYVAAQEGAVVIRPDDGRYRVQGAAVGCLAYTIGLARYELGELDEFVEGGLRLRDDEALVPL